MNRCVTFENMRPLISRTVAVFHPARLCGVCLQVRRGLATACEGEVRLSEQRLRKFLLAEMSLLASRGASPISLRDVLDAASPSLAAEMSHREMPIRYAQRIQLIEELPNWKHHQDLVRVRGLYLHSFRDLRMADPASEGLHAFTQIVTKLKQRMQAVVPLLMEAMHDLRETESMTEHDINSWLDRFLLARLGSEMLTSQFMACVKPGEAEGRGTGIVKSDCSPASICELAATRVRWLCTEHYRRKENLRINVETVSDSPFTFAYVPSYLLYIVMELLKNSARATIDNADSDAALSPIDITISANAKEVAIRIQDSAGGIPVEVAHRVWSYMYSTAESRSDSWESRGTPLAGYGVGLPLSRLYARYLGGSLDLVSMPGLGTAAYLHLRRLDYESCEVRSCQEMLWTPS